MQKHLEMARLGLNTLDPGCHRPGALAVLPQAIDLALPNQAPNCSGSLLFLLLAPHRTHLST